MANSCSSFKLSPAAVGTYIFLQDNNNYSIGIKESSFYFFLSLVRIRIRIILLQLDPDANHLHVSGLELGGLIQKNIKLSLNVEKLTYGL